MGWVLIGGGVLMMLVAVLLTLRYSTVKKHPLVLKDRPDQDRAGRPSASQPPQEQLEKTELL